MSADLDNDPDYGVLFRTLFEKTRAGKLVWQPTAAENTFLAALKGERTFEISLAPVIADQAAALSAYGIPAKPVLKVRDRDGNGLFETPPSDDAIDLYVLVRRVALRIDENIESTTELLEQL